MHFAPALKFFVGLIMLAFLAACSSFIEAGDNRHLQPLSTKTTADLRSMGSSPSQAMLVRIYKESSELEVWKRVGDGSFKHFKTYEICTWSGGLGPKIREGDRQAPEGFYTITPGLMNPKSNFYLSFNLGFPNKFDRAYGRTGSHLMVHGDCSSAGCYAMTDEQIAEIYALARETFNGGNKSFQVQIYPFRMTPQNLARHADSEHLAFWKNLKIGHDHFELTKRPPTYDVCNKEYVFNATASSGDRLDARQSCPALDRNDQLELRVAALQSDDFAQFEQLVAQAKIAEAEKQKRLQEEEAARVAAEQRSEAINDTVNGVGQSIGGFFGNLFGGGQSADAAPASRFVTFGEGDPFPKPPTHRQ